VGRKVLPSRDRGREGGREGATERGHSGTGVGLARADSGRGPRASKCFETPARLFRVLEEGKLRLMRRSDRAVCRVPCLLFQGEASGLSG